MSDERRDERVGARREIAVVVGLGVVVLLVIGLGATVATRTVAQEQALQDAERMTRRVADLVVAPSIAAYLDHDADAVEDLEQAVRTRTSDGHLMELVVWSDDGTVVFSNRREHVGEHPREPPARVTAALRGRVTSAVEAGPPASGQPRPPAGSRRDGVRHVEVFVPLKVEGLATMAVQAYFDDGLVDQLARSLLRQTLPLVVLPLLLLQLVQVPMALSLARRLERHEKERARLLQRALDASSEERIRFAADLHDGPVQDLAGISYALGAVAPAVPERHAVLMARVQEALQRSIGSLRNLMTDLYPPDLGSATLEEALLGLAGPLRADGVEVRVHVDPVGPLAEETVVALYRVAREALANVAKHAGAATVSITLALVRPDAAAEGPLVRLQVTDDGVGIGPRRPDRRAEGHLGLRLVADRVAALGGRLTLVPAAGGGTMLRADVPAAVPGPSRRGGA